MSNFSTYREPFSQESPRAYYESMLAALLEEEGHIRSYDRRPLVFVCHPLTAPEPDQVARNMLRMAEVMLLLSIMTSVRCLNQLPYHGRFNPDDPGDLELKFKIFYHGAISACDRVVVTKGYERSTGCRNEVASARALRKRVFALRSWIEEEADIPEDFEPIDEDRLPSLLDFSGTRRHTMQAGFRGRLPWWRLAKRI